jgi:hypothetical protein
MTLRVILFVLMLFGAFSNGFADLPEDPVEYAAWEEAMLRSIRARAESSTVEDIPRLGQAVFQLAMPTNKEREGRPVFRAAQAALLAIPGHAEYYDRRVREALDKAKEAEGTEDQFVELFAFMDEARTMSAVLRHVPSPETVRVLGEFLFEDWIINHETSDQFGPPGLYAMRALHGLPFVSKPTNNYEAVSDDLETYRLWYEQIRAGTRTFRFEGDPVEYTLAGPLPPGTTITSHRRPPARTQAERSSSIPESPSEGSSPPAIAVMAMAVGLAGVLLWYFIRSREQPSG